MEWDPARGGVLVLDAAATAAEIAAIVAATGGGHLGAAPARGDGWAAIPLGEGIAAEDARRLEALSGVDRIVAVAAPYRLASRAVLGTGGTVGVGSAAVGGDAPVCLVVGSRWAVASEGRLRVLAPLLRETGCTVLHAGRFTTSEDAAGAGIGLRTLRLVRAVADEHGLAVSVEVTDARHVGAVDRYVDVMQVGSHSMQDFGLLRDMGRVDRPVVVKRGAGATVEEFLLAAEYVLSHGNGRVILCEAGIRTFDSSRRPRFEINAVPLIKRSTHLPLLADPSTSIAHARLLPAVARAAVAAGADGLVIEVGTGSDVEGEGAAVDVVTLRRLMTEIRPVARAIGRSLNDGAGDDAAELPRDAGEILRDVDRTLGLVVESIIGVPPRLEVVSQWRHTPPIPAWLGGSLRPEADLLGRCTSYRLGGVRLSRNLAYVDLGAIDPTIAVLLESGQLNLGQLFLDPRIEKRSFVFGTHADAGEIDAVLRERFPGEAAELEPYVWRRYEGWIDGRVVFVVVEALPAATWDRLLRRETALLVQEGTTG